MKKEQSLKFKGFYEQKIKKKKIKTKIKIF